MEISLTPHLENQINSKIASGMYQDAGEVVRESLRQMVERETKKQNLKEQVLKGFEQIEKGETVEVNSLKQLKELARKQK